MLELQLNRVDYIKVINQRFSHRILVFVSLQTASSVTSKCMRLLSRDSVKKETQKVKINHIEERINEDFFFRLP